MPVYPDPQTLSPEALTIYNAIHAPNARAHSIQLKWTGGFVVRQYNLEKVLFEVYDAVEETFDPPAYPDNGYMDVVIANKVKNRREVPAPANYEKDLPVTLSADTINTKLAEVNAWLIEENQMVSKLISPL